MQKDKTIFENFGNEKPFEKINFKKKTKEKKIEKSTKKHKKDSKKNNEENDEDDILVMYTKNYMKKKNK